MMAKPAADYHAMTGMAMRGPIDSRSAFRVAWFDRERTDNVLCASILTRATASLDLHTSPPAHWLRAAAAAGEGRGGGGGGLGKSSPRCR